MCTGSEPRDRRGSGSSWCVAHIRTCGVRLEVRRRRQPSLALCTGRHAGSRRGSGHALRHPLFYLRAVAAGVQPAFKHAVRVGAGVAAAAHAGLQDRGQQAGTSWPSVASWQHGGRGGVRATARCLAKPPRTPAGANTYALPPRRCAPLSGTTPTASRHPHERGCTALLALCALHEPCGSPGKRCRCSGSAAGRAAWPSRPDVQTAAGVCTGGRKHKAAAVKCWAARRMRPCTPTAVANLPGRRSNREAAHEGTAGRKGGKGAVHE